MNTNQLGELKDQVKKYIDLADAEVVQMVHVVLKAHVEDSLWLEAPTHRKTDVNETICRQEADEVMTYEQVKKEYPQWFMN